MSKLFLTLVFSALLGQYASAQQAPEPMARVMSHLMGTTFARVLPSFANGKLYGCGIEFAVIAKDWQYRRGGYIRVGGQFGLMTGKGAIASVLKATLHDINTQSFTFTPSIPASAYFVDNYQTSAQYVTGQIESDTPGAVFVVFQGPPVFKIISDGMTRNRVQIALARKRGGADIPIEIEADVAEAKEDGTRVRSAQIAPDFFACVGKLLDASK